MKDVTLINTQAIGVGCVVEWFKASATAGGLYHPDKRPNQDCWLRSGFESPRRQLVVSLFKDPIRYGRFTGAN